MVALQDKMKIFLFANALSILLLYVDGCAAQGKCTDTELPKMYLDEAIQMLQKAKNSYPTEYLLRMAEPTDCYDLLNLGHNTSGIYTIWPQNRIMKERSIPVYCDMKTDGGGWTEARFGDLETLLVTLFAPIPDQLTLTSITHFRHKIFLMKVIQRRGDFKRPIDFFYKDWEEYKKGFGYLDKDFWLGNDYIFAISNQKEYTARFDMKAVDGERKYAHYDFFWIDDENHNYMLHIRDYSGDAGDSMYPKHNGQMFSTKDKKNDNRKEAAGCAESFKGAWWYNACHDSNLNGLYLKGPHESHANGVNWKSWRGHKESLEETEIKIRPKVYKKIKSAPEPEPHPESDTPL